MELGAQILDPGGGSHAKAPKAGGRHPRLPPVSGVGWDDADVAALRAQRAESDAPAAEEAAPLPEPIAGVLAMGEWRVLVHWEDVLSRYDAPPSAPPRSAPTEANGEAAAAATPAQTPGGAAPAAASRLERGPSPAAERPAAAPAIPQARRPASPQPQAAATPAPASAAPLPSYLDDDDDDDPPSLTGYRLAPTQRRRTDVLRAGAPPPRPAAEEAAPSPWRPSSAPAAGPSPWKPAAQPGGAASPWKPEAAPPLTSSPQDPPPAEEPAPAEPLDRGLPPDTPKRVAVLMKRGELAKSAQILELWLRLHPEDEVAAKMRQLCEARLAGTHRPTTTAPTLTGKVPAPNPAAIPVVDMVALMSATGFTPTDAYVLSRIDGHTEVRALPLLVPELSDEDLTLLLVRSWKAGVLHFKQPGGGRGRR